MLRVAFLLSLSGCGVVAGTIGCDLRTESAANGYEDRCQERDGIQGNAAFGGFCETLGGDSVKGGCPTEGIVAGCELDGSNGTGGVIDWYYEPVTREEVESTCADEGTVVDP